MAGPGQRWRATALWALESAGIEPVGRLTEATLSEIHNGSQVRDRNIAAMGLELGELFTLLSTELTWMRWRWEQHKRLFAEDASSKFDVLNGSAPFFFGIIQQVLWQDVMLGIARLTGPEVSVGRQNLSVKRLTPFVPATLSTAVNAHIAEVESTSRFAVDWRNRHIAHRDWDLARGKAARPLATATRDAVEEALGAVAALLNAVQLYFCGSTTWYGVDAGPHGAGSLLAVLRDGLRLETLRSEALEKGDYDPKWWHDNEAGEDNKHNNT